MNQTNILNRDSFIANVRDALKKPPGAEPEEKNGLKSDPTGLDIDKELQQIKQRSHDDQKKLLNLLKEQAKPLNLQVREMDSLKSTADSIVQLIKEKSPEWGDSKKVVTWKDPLIEQLKLKEALAKCDIPVYVTEPKQDEDLAEAKKRIRNRVIDSFAGITTADYCLAETGTLVMKNRLNRPRSVSLVPSIHIAVIELKQLIQNLKEYYFLQKWDTKEKKEGLTNYLSFISGPSKTADIELELVHGAHGPCELHLYVIIGN